MLLVILRKLHIKEFFFIEDYHWNKFQLGSYFVSRLCGFLNVAVADKSTNNKRSAVKSGKASSFKL